MSVLVLLLAGCAPPPFSCADAAAALGHPDATVQACDAAPHLPEVYQIVLTGGDAGARLILGARVVQGRVQDTAAPGALAAFLDGLGPARDTLTLTDVMYTLRAFDAFPPGIDAKSAMFDLPGVGRSQVRTAPFRVELYNGRAPEPGFLGATLEGPPWRWTLRRLDAPGGAWQPAGEAALR